MHYLDIRINGTSSPEPQEGSGQLEKRGADAEDIPLAELSSRALSILHGAFAQRGAAQTYALALPNGMGPNNLPTSVALLGRAWGEATLTALGARYQRETAFHLKRPPLITHAPT